MTGCPRAALGTASVYILAQARRRSVMTSKNTICLWYDGAALDAAQFYAATFPASAVGAVHRAPGDYPAGKQGHLLTVEFTVMGVPCLRSAEHTSELQSLMRISNAALD